MTIGLAIRAFATGLLGSASRHETPAVEPIRIDLNRADVQELQALPGVGPVRAEAIVLHRIRRGPFRAPDELLQVDGIGTGTLELLAPFLLPLPGELAAGRR